MVNAGELVWVTVPPEFCSGGDCVEIAAIGNDWFRIRSNQHRTNQLAVTGSELRAFILAVKAGFFDKVAGMP